MQSIRVEVSTRGTPPRCAGFLLDRLGQLDCLGARQVALQSGERATVPEQDRARGT